MAKQGLKEKDLEIIIENNLIESGYVQGLSKNYDKSYALDLKVLFEFLESTQKDKLEKLKTIYKDQYVYKIKTRIDDQLKKRGLINVLRKGIDDRGVHLDFAYFKPATSMNPELNELYGKNIFSVNRQLFYSLKNENSLDMVVFLNGLPIITLELKNEFTGQNYNSAIKQYKEDRNPNEKLFTFKERCIVHFALDTSEVHMTTRLSGKQTYFLPFNQGNEEGKGNPENPTGENTAYLWEQILQKDMLLKIIERFAFVEKKRRKQPNGKITYKETLIFPRYHQLDVINKVENDVLTKGLGQNYLIQHSAGSGKTYSISWLSHRLSSIHNESNINIFDKVIVITDRVVLDDQLQTSIYQLDHKHGVVAKINKDSNQLAKALQDKTKVIITTIQKFPFVLDKMDELKTSKFAVIIDEAHSSTAGENMASLKEVLSDMEFSNAADLDSDSNNEDIDVNDVIMGILDKKGPKDNISFFAFTATPKQKTLELFGTYDESGKPHAFHLYSMKQAIEEGFILDVLKNYMTYQTYFQLKKDIEEDFDVKPSEVSRKMRKYVNLHPTAITQKTEIMIEHFREHTRYKINGRAKAMVVTSSRLNAVKYKEAFDKYISERGYYDMKTLVAFSGVVNNEGTDVKENQINGFGEKQLPSEFNKDEYKVLIVADKYQTGFDQPLLHTMYVDKKLNGVKAVQTLNRLNRIHPNKNDTFVMDFVNDIEDIKESFAPYYINTEINKVTDPNDLYDYRDSLTAIGVYDEFDLEEFSEIFYSTKELNARQRNELTSLINKGFNNYKELDNDKQSLFKQDSLKFTRLYSFVTQLADIKDVNLHKMYIYLTYLNKKLILKEDDGDALSLKDKVSLEYFKIKNTFEGSGSLSESDTKELENNQNKSTVKEEEEKDSFTEIIERLNQRFGTEFTESDKLSIVQIKTDFSFNQDLIAKAKTNTLEEFKYAFEKEFLGIVINRMGINEDFFAKILDDPDFKEELMRMMLSEVYTTLRSNS